MPSKSCKLNTIPTTFLKTVLKHCLPSVVEITNLSLGTGEFCERWKSAVVQPLIKAISKGTIKTNYRTVCNLPSISKIIEKYTLNQLTTHCNMQNLLLEYQSACRKFHSCETSLLKIVNDSLWAMEQKQITAVLIMDLLAAFDTVNNDLLLDVLRKILHQEHSNQMVQELAKTEKFKVWMNGLYLSEQIMAYLKDPLRMLTYLTAMPQHSHNCTRLSNPEWLHRWPFNMENLQTIEKKHQQRQ